MRTGKIKYDDSLAAKMYLFFSKYDDQQSAPSFSKFARSIGTTLAVLESFRSRKKFGEAWRECDEIRRDYLTDRALTRRFDPTFVKHLLASVDGADEDVGLTVRITVEE